MIHNLLRFVIILGVVCLSIGGGVACLYAVFKADIEQRDLAAKQEAIEAVVPEGAEVNTDAPIAGEPFAPDAVYAARDARANVVAYVASGEAQGYSSVVRLMAGVRAGDLSILRVVVLSQQETPGLGATVAEEKSNFTLWEKVFGPGDTDKTEQLVNPFLGRFRGKKESEIADIQGITAATITSNATRRAVGQAIARIREAVKKNDE